MPALVMRHTGLSQALRSARPIGVALSGALRLQRSWWCSSRCPSSARVATVVGLSFRNLSAVPMI